MQWAMPEALLDLAYLVQLVNHHPVLRLYNSLHNRESMELWCKGLPMPQTGRL
jgi:hypothetical protein